MFKINRGDTYDQPLTFQVNGQPLNITGCTVRFTVKRIDELGTGNDTNAIIAKTITSHTNPGAGVTRLVITSAETQAIASDDYYYDVQITFTDNSVLSIRKDIFRVEQSVTDTNTLI